MPSDQPRTAQGLSFPCDYEMKIFGPAEADMPALVCTVLAGEGVEVDASTLVRRDSAGGRYVAISVTVSVASRAALEALYAAFRRRPEVKWLL